MIPALFGVLAAARLIPKAVQVLKGVLAGRGTVHGVSEQKPEAYVKYTFDKSGNLTGLTTGNTTTAFSYNSLNQQTSPAGQVFDAKGQTTTTNGRTYEWDDQGRLTAVVVGTQRSEFSYNGASQRTKITEFTNGTVTSKKLYFWLGGSIVCERDGLQTGFPITKSYFSQGEVRGTTKLYYATDHLGSIRELVDSTGAVRAEYSYSTYGEQTKVSGDLEADFAWAGLWNHKASGLYLATYRAFDPVNKRWISRDPLGEGVDYNLYRYCGNSPVGRVDPNGLRDLTYDMQHSTGVFNPGYDREAAGRGVSAMGIAGLALSPEIAGSVAANLIRLLGGSALSTTEATGLVGLSEALVPAATGETAFVIGHGATLARNMGAILLFLEKLKKTRKVTRVTLLVCKAAKHDKEAIQTLTALGYTVNASNTDLAVVFGIVLFAEWANPFTP